MKINTYYYGIQGGLMLFCIFAIISGIKYNPIGIIVVILSLLTTVIFYILKGIERKSETKEEKTLTEKEEAQIILKQLNRNKKVRVEFDKLIRKEKLKRLK